MADALVVFTACTGAHCVLWPPLDPSVQTQGVRFVRFTTDPNAPCDGWENVPITLGAGDAKLATRRVNVLPWEYFDAEYSIWMDSTHQLVVNPWALLIDHMRYYDFAAFHHPWRSCIYDEAAVLLEHDLATPEQVYPQVIQYAKDGYPHRRGMLTGTVMIRRHSSGVRRFCEAWWKELSSKCPRGELSLSYVEWRLQFPIGIIPGDPYNNGMFNCVPNPGWPTTSGVGRPNNHVLARQPPGGRQ